MPRKILLFVPGYYGSMLEEEGTRKVRWAKASNFLLSRTGVSKNIPGTKIGSFKKLVPSQVLKNVLVFPRYWDVDSYGKTLTQLEEFTRKERIELATVAYDWRDDFISCLDVIDQKIKSFNLTDHDELYVVAHSMGGLLMSYYLRYGAQDVIAASENWAGLKHVRKVALIAPPLHGLMILFRDIEDGTCLGINRNLLSGLDYSTFNSSYFFLPPKGEDIGMKKNGEKLSLGIHDIDKWEKNNWGPFRYATPKERAIVRGFVDEHMSRSSKFHELLRAPVITPPPFKMPLLHVRGLGYKTKELATLKPSKKRLGYAFLKEGEVDGDGTVTAKSGASLSYFKHFEFKFVDCNLGHLDVLAKPEAQVVIQEFFKN